LNCANDLKEDKTKREINISLEMLWDLGKFIKFIVKKAEKFNGLSRIFLAM
jgi:hypothetical protein